MINLSSEGKETLANNNFRQLKGTKKGTIIILVVGENKQPSLVDVVPEEATLVKFATNG